MWWFRYNCSSSRLGMGNFRGKIRNGFGRMSGIRMLIIMWLWMLILGVGYICLIWD